MPKKLSHCLLSALLAAVLIFICLTGCSRLPDMYIGTGSSVDGAQEAPVEPDIVEAAPEEKIEEEPEALSYFDRSAVPDYTGSPYFVINGNVPFFDEAELLPESFEYYSSLDALGRCGVCIACVGKDIMPTEPRGEIGMVKPTGWNTVRYDGLVDGNYLYNRCHLIGYQLTAENANEKNLITGTRYMNVDGMLPFENMVADYVIETGNHVLYRITPIFDADNLLADGVLMEAESVEDKGESILFCVYCYNVQPGIIIDYATGKSELAIKAETTKENLNDYVLNTNTKKFHYPDCESVQDMNEENKKEVKSGREDLIKKGYEPCGNCNP